MSVSSAASSALSTLSLAIAPAAILLFWFTSASPAYNTFGWSWNYQAHPIETHFIICENDAPVGASNRIQQAAKQWGYAKLNIIFDTDDCPTDRPVNYVEFIKLNVTALTTALPDPGTNQTKGCLIQFNKDKNWYVGNGDPDADENDCLALHYMSLVIVSGLIIPIHLGR